MPRSARTRPSWPARRRTAALAALALAAAGLTAAGAAPAAAEPSCPWVSATDRTPAQRADMVLDRMTLDEEIQEVHGSDGAYVGNVPALPRLCVPALHLEDGPAGVADGMTGVTQLPAPVSAAASWDTGLVHAYGAAVGAEERGKGANVDLGPTVNIVRDPRWGRAFESYGEDPLLAGTLGAADIRGVQSAGVMAQLKHLAVYNQETARNTPADNAVVDERTLREIYLRQFATAIAGGHPSSLMCSYSWINGTDACADGTIQNDIAKGDWGFDGFITSDWGADHSTVASPTAAWTWRCPARRTSAPR